MKDRAKLKTRYIPSLFFAVAPIIMMFAPYQQDNTLGANSDFHSIMLVVLYIILGFSLLFSIPIIKLKELKIDSFLNMIPAIALFLMNVFHSYSDADVNAGGLVTLYWILFCVLPKDVRARSFVFFKKILCFLCLIGIVCYLSYLLNLSLPYEKIPYYYGDGSMNYISYKISFLYERGGMLRLCGICNEPGYLGTFCALILCADKMNLKKGINIVFLAAGLLTFSAAFLLINITYITIKIFMKAHREANRKKKFFYYVLPLVILFSYIWVFPSIRTGNYAIDATIDRLAITSEGLAGDNRTTDELDARFDLALADAPVFGLGRGYVDANNLGSNLSYKIYVIECGIVGCIILWGSLLLAVLYKNTRNPKVLAFVIVFFLSIYQRPTIITVPYLVLLIGGIEYIKLSEVKNLEIEHEKNS